jgi:hypothetical protein
MEIANELTSKSQYETQLKKWRLCKNIRTVEWKLIFAILGQLPGHEVLFYGNPLSLQVIQKAYQHRRHQLQPDQTMNRSVQGEAIEFWQKLQHD